MVHNWRVCKEESRERVCGADEETGGWEIWVRYWVSCEGV